jgi:hypothetical protein
MIFFLALKGLTKENRGANLPKGFKFKRGDSSLHMDDPGGSSAIRLVSSAGHGDLALRTVLLGMPIR